MAEALGLKWCDVDLQGGWIRIGRIFCRATKKVEDRTKSGKARVIGLNGALKEVLLRERHRGYGLGQNDLIILLESGQPPGHGRVQNMFLKNIRQAGLGKHGMHDLRHSFASIFIEFCLCTTAQ